MKSYLRLLFVGTVLLIVLGLFNDQRSKPDDQQSETGGLEQTEVQSALLPLDPFQTTSLLSSSQNYPRGFRNYMRHSQETRLSRLSKNELQVARRIIGEISPNLLHRTGHFIYCHSGAEIPS